MKMVKFGSIHEMDDGKLMFEDFHIDCEGANKSGSECLLELTIERLKSELVEERAKNTKNNSTLTA